MGSRWMRNTFIYMLIVVAVVAIVWSLLAPRSSSTETKDIGDIITAAQQGQVQSIEVNGDNLTVHLEGDSTAYTASAAIRYRPLISR
jgi:cell division protease FtsH